MNQRHQNLLAHLAKATNADGVFDKSVELLKAFLIPCKRFEDAPRGGVWKFVERCQQTPEGEKSIWASGALDAHFKWWPQYKSTDDNPDALLGHLFSYPFSDEDQERFEREILQTLNPTPTPTTP